MHYFLIYLNLSILSLQIVENTHFLPVVIQGISVLIKVFQFIAAVINLDPLVACPSINQNKNEKYHEVRYYSLQDNEKLRDLSCIIFDDSPMSL